MNEHATRLRNAANGAVLSKDRADLIAAADEIDSLVSKLEACDLERRTYSDAMAALQSRLDSLIRAIESDPMCKFSKSPYRCLGWWNERRHDNHCPVAIAKSQEPSNE